MEIMPLDQVPRAFREEACRAIFDFSIGLVKLHGSDLVHNARLGGSGTLVQIDGTYGILTACHVLDHLKGEEAIGLILVNTVRPFLHRVTVRSERMRWVRIACSDKEGDGPDLGILLLSPVDVGYLKAQKSFYNLANREWLLCDPPTLDTGVWFICGFPDEATKERGPERGFKSVKVFEGACGDVRVEKDYRVGNFGYLDFEVAYGGVNDPPRSFSGFSGGGLWQVRVMRTPEGELKVKDRLLSGVAFCQNPPIGNRRVIKCHGRDGIYTHAIQAIKNEAS